jgi:hypothetical protein
MKTSLFTAALLASQLSAAQRIGEVTGNSWNYQNLSIETKGNYVVSDLTEPHPVTGLITPTLKLNNPGGAPLGAYLNYPDPVYLMDFFLRPSNTLVFAGMVDDIGTTSSS